MSALPQLLGAAIPTPRFADQDLCALEALQDAIDSCIEPMAGEHDAVGRYPTAAVAALKASGILKTAVPTRFGGRGAGHALSMEAQVRLAVADSAVAQIFKIHDELVREIFDYCPEQLGPLLSAAVLDDDAILGLAAAEDGPTVDAPMSTIADRQADGSYILNGSKVYTTGAAEADYIAVWAFDPVAGSQNPLAGLQLNLVARATPGVTVHRDWDNLGQRATDSGRVTFSEVRTHPALRASGPDRMPGVDRSLRYHAGFAAILVGLGIAALHHSGEFLRTKARPWPSAGVARASEDPLVERLAGELVADVASAYLLVQQSGLLLDGFGRGELTRTELAVPISVAKSVATRASLRATNEVFTLMGTRATRRSEHFDRYWRNARTLSLHDPLEWKHLEIGNNVLNGWDPPPGIYT